MVVFNPVICL